MRQQPGISAKYRMAPPGFDKREPGLNPNGRAGKWGNAGGKSNRAGRQEVKVIVLPLLIVRLMFDSFRFNGNCNLVRECYSYGVLLEPKILEIQIAHNPYLARG